MVEIDSPTSDERSAHGKKINVEDLLGDDGLFYPNEMRRHQRKEEVREDIFGYFQCISLVQ